MDEKGINYVTASYELKEDDFEFEKKNIVQYTDKKDDYNLSLLHLLYPTFTYNREDIKIIDGKPPYGECFTTAFNEDGTLLACGYNNGHVNIFDLKHPKKPPVKFSPSTYPITSIKWNNKKKTTLLVGAADGYISHWHTSSGKNLHSLKEINNSINSVCYSHDYKNFITAGNDISVRLYDENMKSLITIMKPYKFNEPGHSGRIFCCKFFPNDMSTIYSGGWDKTIQFYDTRSGKVANSIYGPEIVGDSLDMYGYTLASGAWSTDKQIQLWDIRTLKCICEVNWENKSPYYPTYIYSVKFNVRRDRKFLSIGAVNKPLFRIFDYETFNSSLGLKADNMPTPIFGCGETYQSCFTTDFAKISSNKELFCCGCVDGGTRIYSLETKNN
jgi:WD40 repeat protein